MASTTPKKQRSRALILEIARAHVRTIPAAAIAVGVGLLAVAALLGLYGWGVAAAVPSIDSIATTPDATALATILLMVPVVLVATLAALVWVGIVTQAANAAVSSRGVSLSASLSQVLRRTPRAFVVGLLAVLAVALALALAPVFVVAGILGLAATPLLARSRFADRRPRVRTLVLWAVPLGVAVWVVVRTVQSTTSVWLAGSGIRAAFADAAERSRGLELQLILSLLIGTAVTWGATQGSVLLTAQWGLGDTAGLVGQLLALIVVGPVLFVALVVLYRRGGSAPAAAAKVAVPRRAALRARVAVAVVVAMLVPLGIGVTSPPAYAEVGSTEATFQIQTVPFSPFPAGDPTSVQVLVYDPHSETTRPTGTVRIWIDGAELIGPFVVPTDGNPVEIEQTFAAGPHRIEATYSGDDTYATAETFLDVTATAPTGDPVATEIAEFTVLPPSVSPAGTPVTATVRVAVPSSAVVPTGQVSMSFYGAGDPFDTQPLVAGVAQFTMTLPPGANDLVARYLPDTGFLPSSLDYTQYVGAAASTTTIEADSATSSVGQNVRLVARVSSLVVATGPVTFEDRPAVGPAISLGSAPLIGGVATLDTTALSLGDHSIVAVYPGIATITGSESAPLDHPVTGASVSVSVVADTETPVHGTTIKLTVEVAPVAPATGTPTGLVSIRVGGVVVGSGSLGGGTVDIFVPAGPAGDVTYVADYAGSDPFGAGSGSLTLTVGKRGTTTQLTTPSGLDYTYGDSQTYTGSVSSSGDSDTPTGTVELWIGEDHVADGILNGSGSFSITTTAAPVQATLETVAYVRYLGDDNHLPSEVLPENGVTLELAKADVAPALTATPTEPVVGSQVELVATIPDRGDSATGFVLFTTSLGVPLAAAVPVAADGTARVTVTVGQANPRYVAHYYGDHNYEARDSDELVLTTVKAAAVVTIAASAPFVYGDVLDLIGTVTIDGATATNRIGFRVGTLTLGSAPIVGGEARLQVCAGYVDDCPVGMPVLGAAPANLTAWYAEDDINEEGVSAPLAFEVLDAATTVSLEITSSTNPGNPTHLRPGDKVTLTATVDAVNLLLAPTSGYVVFYGEGTTRQYLGRADVIDGVATLEDVMVGQESEELVWGADRIRAEYATFVEPFGPSADEEAVTITRLPVTLSAPTINAPAFELTWVTVTLTSAGSYDADFTGAVDITSNSGATCRDFVAAGENTASCRISWSSVGGQSYTATYAGDFIHDASTLNDLVIVEQATSVIRATTTPSDTVTVGQSVAVAWQLPGAGATGTVTVLGDGQLWCNNVPVTDLGCSGSFDASSATGADVEITVSYSGDTTWASVDEVVLIEVNQCAILDVRSNGPGTVTVGTAPNCGDDRYYVGTTVTVTAHPGVGGELVAWLAYADPDAPGLVPVSTDLTTSFVLGAGSESWVHVASFGVPCSTITPNASGSGGIFVYPLSNCTTTDDKPGWLYGTDVSIYPDPALNPLYGEPDVFRLFGELEGASVSKDIAGSLRMRLTVTGPTVVPIIFSPQCHPVSVVFSPAVAGDTSRMLTPQNCTSIGGNGYYRGSVVEVEATPGDAHHVVTGWTIDGVARPELGTQNTASFTIGAANPVVAQVDFVTCYALDVKVDGLIIPNVGPVGQVARSLEPNCPDGSERYLVGSTVTLTPEILYAGVSFSSWDADPRSGYLPVGSPTGLVPSAARTFTLTADASALAGFYYAPACSPIRVFGEVSAISIVSSIHQPGLDGSGCGNGFYFDELKMYASLFQVSVTDPSIRRYRSTLDVTITQTGAAPLYVSVSGDIGAGADYPCFNQVSTEVGWTGFGAVRGTSRCLATGPIMVMTETCQAVVSEALVHVEGEPQDVRHGYTMPSTVFGVDEDGNVFGTDYTGYQFAEGVAIKREAIDADEDGVEDVVDYTQPIDPSKYSYDFIDTPTGSCAFNNAFPLKTDVAVFASQPPGFNFTGWAQPLDPAWPFLQPYVTRTTGTSAALTVTPLYEVSCFTVTLGQGISLRGEAPRCPGTAPEENRYIAGTVIQVQAENYFNGRFVNKFKTGVIAGQVWEDPETQDIVGYVLVTQDHNVTADYPSTAERVGRGIAQGFKIVAGVLAVAGPIVLGALFPPAGILFAVLGAGAGIASLAGNDEIASAFDLINPTAITQCAARWAFSNTGAATGGGNYGAIGSTGFKLVNLLRGKDVLAVSLNMTTYATGGAAFIAGLYQSGILNAPLKDWQTVEELAGTDTFTGCLDQMWRAGGSNITG